MSVDFTVRGVPVEEPIDPVDFVSLYGREVRYELRRGVAVAGVARDAAEIVELAGEDDDVVEIEDADGVVSFHRADALAEEARGSSRSGPGPIDLTGFLDAPSRGGGAQMGSVRRYAVALPDGIVSAVDDLVGAARGAPALDGGLGMLVGLLPQSLLDPAARAAARRLADWIDEPVDDQAPPQERRKKAKTRGIYRVGGDLRLEPGDRIQSAPPPSRDPYLLLLHGTFSHTEGAFGQFRGTEEWDTIAGRYEGRMLALEHATLGRSPVENALMAAELIPDGTRLHLLSHSRGGLVGDALSYALHQDPQISAYPADHPDPEAWQRLRAALQGRNITVERFARVACPGRGTTLISNRLDRVAKILFNVFKLVPVLRETGVAALVQKFLLAVLDQRTDPRVIPGLEAQIPGSPLLRTLLTAHPVTDDGLGCITGDVEGRRIARRLLVWGADLFYREDHDLVVPTSSMDGGLNRTGVRRAFFRGGDVDHTHYFGNQDSRAAVDGWLREGPGSAASAFRESPTGPIRGVRDTRVSAAAGVVLLIPDVLGSKEQVRGEESWPDVAGIARIGPRAALGTAGVTVDGLVAAYDPLCAALGERFTVTEWTYDARQSLDAASAALSGTIGELLDSGPAPHLVAHGAGALVALGALTRDGRQGLLARWRDGGGRAVLLGPPLDGSWLIAARLDGRDELSVALALLDGSTTPAEVGSCFSRWEGLHALRPDDTGAGLREPLLPKDWSGIVAVRGVADQTISRIDPDEIHISDGGDGLSLVGNRDGLATWFSTVPHADLPGDPTVAATILDLLAGATPTRLPNESPVVPSGSAILPDLRGKLPMPTADSIVRAAWGGGRPIRRKGRLTVRVVHGDLRESGGTTIVGHQDGTPIGGAERAADDRLDGALNRRLALSQYPGPLGTSEVFLRGADGMVVVGLGDAGDLTPKALTAGITRAVLKLAASRLDQMPAGSAPTPLSVSSVLLGTSLIPPMPVENSLTAIIQGVRQANRRLRDQGVRQANRRPRDAESAVHVEALTIVEKYEERAIVAVRAGRRMADTLRGDHDDQIQVEHLLVDGCGGEPGLPPPDYYESDQWRTVRIVSADPDDAGTGPDELSALSFTSIGRSARAEQQVTTGQRKLLAALIDEAVHSDALDEQVLNTLYELLVPNSLKFQGYGSENLMLVVDRQAGSIPLEMLATRPDDQRLQPLAVEVGMVRRLETRAIAELSRRSSGRWALVIGDPSGTGLNRLDGARLEANRVKEFLEDNDFAVESIIPDAADEQPHVVRILNALYRRDYRVVHIAGHGHFDPYDPTRSGVLIGPDTYLGALEIAQMRATPDLVFLNCCHLGAMAPTLPGGAPATEPARVHPNRLASSISRQLIENGVQAVVAAGWAVADDAAVRFAERFYGGLLAGQDLGRASLEARREIWERFRTRTNTWGAYQVWGPPAFRMMPSSPSGRKDEPPVARREFRDALDALRRRAADAQDDELDRLGKKLQEIRDSASAQWLGGRERILIGDIWTLLAHYDKAVAEYERAKDDWNGEGSLRAVEQLANVRAKWAVQAAGNGKGSGDGDPATLLEQAAESAELLVRVGPTPERLAIQGSVERRRAICLPERQAAKVTAALVRAHDCYRRASELHRTETGKVDYYSALNEVVLGWLVSQRSSKHQVDLDRVATTIDGALTAADQAPCPHFWSRVTRADAALARALIAGTIGDRTASNEILAHYTTAFADSSRRDRISVVEHLDIIERLTPTRSTATRAALAALRHDIEHWAPERGPLRT